MSLRNLFGLGRDLPKPGPASAAARRSASDHVTRFERAIAQCEPAVERGEKGSARLAELHRWLDYYRKIAAFEAGGK